MGALALAVVLCLTLSSASQTTVSNLWRPVEFLGYTWVPALPAQQGLRETHSAACSRLGLGVTPTVVDLSVPWNSTTVHSISSALGASEAKLQSCCSPSLWCSQVNETCYTNSYDQSSYTNFGWTSGAEVVPVYTCVTESTTTPPGVYSVSRGSGAKGIKIAIDGTGFGTVASAVDIHVGDQRCSDVNICTSQCTPCSSASDCGDDMICVGFGSGSKVSRYCLALCNSWSCGCGASCQQLSTVQSGRVILVCMYSSWNPRTPDSICSRDHAWSPSLVSGLNSRVECTLPAQCPGNGPMPIQLSVQNHAAVTLAHLPNISYTGPETITRNQTRFMSVSYTMDPSGTGTGGTGRRASESDSELDGYAAPAHINGRRLSESNTTANATTSPSATASVTAASTATASAAATSVITAAATATASMSAASGNHTRLPAPTANTTANATAAASSTATATSSASVTPTPSPSSSPSPSPFRPPVPVPYFRWFNSTEPFSYQVMLPALDYTSGGCSRDDECDDSNVCTIDTCNHNTSCCEHSPSSVCSTQSSTYIGTVLTQVRIAKTQVLRRPEGQVGGGTASRVECRGAMGSCGGVHSCSMVTITLTGTGDVLWACWDAVVNCPLSDLPLSNPIALPLRASGVVGPHASTAPVHHRKQLRRTRGHWNITI